MLWECGVTFRMSFCSIFIIVHVWFLSIVNKDTDKFDFIVFWINGFLAGSNVFGLFFLFTFEIKLPSPVSLSKIKEVSYAICFILPLKVKVSYFDCWQLWSKNVRLRKAIPITFTCFKLSTIKILNGLLLPRTIIE